MLKVTHVQALPDHQVRVTLSNHKTVNVDVSHYLTAPGYESLREPDVFKQVSVDEWEHGITWPGDVGIPVSTLYRMAREQSGKAWPVEQFNDWMQRNHLSVASAADVLGVTRRTIIYYHTGTKPIPLVVELACEGYEARKATNVAYRMGDRAEKAPWSQAHLY